MKKIFLLLFLTACATRNNDWDSGAQKQQTYSEEQRQEQVEHTNLQFPTAGKPGASQSQPF